MGEAVLRNVAKNRSVDIEVDSCGTISSHAGEDPDERTIQVCKKHNIPINHKARSYNGRDFVNFTHILAADEKNYRELLRMKPANTSAEIRLWGSYLDDEPIPDPYYGSKNGFEAVYQQCVRLSNAFLDTVTTQTSS